MVKSHNKLVRILLFALCIFSLISLFFVPSSAMDFTPSGDFAPSYLVSQASIRSVSFWDSSDPNARISAEWLGLLDGGYMSGANSTLNENSEAQGYFVYNYFNRQYGFPGPSALVNYTMWMLSSNTTSYDRVRFDGGHFYAHAYNGDFLQPYSGNWTPYALISSSAGDVTGSWTMRVKVRTFKRYTYTSDFVSGSWNGVSYDVRELEFSGYMTSDLMIIAPSWEQLISNNIYNSAVDVHNGRVVSTTPLTGSGSDDYVEILDYSTEFVFNESVPSISTRLTVYDMLCPIDNQDAFVGISALNGGLTFTNQMKVEIGSFLRDSLSEFLEFEIFPNFTLSAFFWLIFGFIVVTALIFLMRR